MVDDPGNVCVVDVGNNRVRTFSFAGETIGPDVVALPGGAALPSDTNSDGTCDDVNGNGRPVLPGITGRLEFVDASGHLEDLERYRARGYVMRGNRIAVVTDHDADLLEVHRSSRGSVDLGGVTVERCPPAPAAGARWERRRHSY